jgi:hypothetical protein
VNLPIKVCTVAGGAGCLVVAGLLLTSVPSESAKHDAAGSPVVASRDQGDASIAWEVAQGQSQARMGYTPVTMGDILGRLPR